MFHKKTTGKKLGNKGLMIYAITKTGQAPKGPRHKLKSRSSKQGDRIYYCKTFFRMPSPGGINLKLNSSISSPCYTSFGKRSVIFAVLLDIFKYGSISLWNGGDINAILIKNKTAIKCNFFSLIFSQNIVVVHKRCRHNRVLHYNVPCR